MEDLKLRYVSFEQAERLKEVGFPKHISFTDESAPSLELAAKWLRHQKGILTIPKVIYKMAGNPHYQDWVKIKNKTGFLTTGKVFSDYDDALSVGIDEAIDYLIKQQQ